ncbi:MAG: cytochrome c oxidase subunit II [Candidatus Limnocylindrales bacterium]|nr:cytochrome c oxidase subunit II [Candidatus Limnocylindrales bacterium]
MKRHLIGVGVLWLILTAIGEALAQVDILPAPGSDKAADIAAAFRFLVVLAVPVFTFVVATLIYSVVRFRVAGSPAGDGPPIRGRGRVPRAWFGITAGLTLVIMIYPGLTELPKFMRPATDPDLVVEISAFQWAWKAHYPAGDAESDTELVLPVDRSVRFDVTSLDVIHAFWVPAFAMRVDAVPGLTTSVSLRPTTLGAYAADPAYRLQCSQLCGIAHSRMMMPVRVVPQAEFVAWLAQQRNLSGGGGASLPPGGEELSISAKDIRFSLDRLETRAGVPTRITFRNDDAGIPHNIAVYQPGAADQLVDGARSLLEEGPIVQSLVVPALPAGRYPFRCDAHPLDMVGVLDVK